MNALGGIGLSSYQLYTRQYEQSLEADVAKVSDSEAENGASQSDSVRFAAKEQSKDDKAVPLSTYLKRAVKFNPLLKKEAAKQQKTEDSCPIAQARSKSSIGENVPLNWLVADQMGGQASTPQREDFTTPKADLSFQSPAALFVPESSSREIESGGTLLSQEWLLSPCA